MTSEQPNSDHQSLDINFFYALQIRLPSWATDDVDEDPTGNKALWDRGLLNGASQKADFVASFHVGEICMSLQVT